MPILKTAAAALIAGCLAFSAFGHSIAGPDKVAVKAGRIIPMTGDVIEQGVILIRDGKIEAVGHGLKIPYDYWVVDAGQSTVFPGMVEAFTQRGLDRTNESLPVVPFLDVYDALDPSSVHFEDALRDGISTLFISQGGNTVIGGIARVVKPIGMTVEEMTVQADAGIILSFAPKSGFDRMIQMATFRETFHELDRYMEDLAESKYEEKLKREDKSIDAGPAEARKRGLSLVKDEDIDFKHFNLVRLTNGELNTFVYCAAPMDVIHAIDVAEEHGFMKRVVFVLGSECYKAVERLKECARPVILGPDMVYLKKDPITGDEEEIFVPAVFYDAKIPFAIRSDPNLAFGMRYLWYQAATLVRNGIPRQTALEAITTAPAAAIGLKDRVGAIAPGMDANLLILSGDPLDSETWVEKVVIEGCVVYEKERDYRLEELLTGKELSPTGETENIEEAEVAEETEENKKDPGKDPEDEE